MSERSIFFKGGKVSTEAVAIARKPRVEYYCRKELNAGVSLNIFRVLKSFSP